MHYLLSLVSCSPRIRLPFLSKLFPYTTLFRSFLISYSSWVVGSFLGGFVGDIIPDSISQSFGIALFAMFIALLIPSVKTNYLYGIVALLAMVINYGLSQFLQEGWSIVLATILASLVGFVFLRRRV